MRRIHWGCIMGKSNNTLSRRGFIHGVGAGGVALGAAASLNCGTAAAATPAKEGAMQAKPSGSYYILNVRLESGFIREKDEIVGTATELATLRIENGKIAEILPASAKLTNAQAPRFDAAGQLLLPTFRFLQTI